MKGTGRKNRRRRGYGEQEVNAKEEEGEERGWE